MVKKGQVKFTRNAGLFWVCVPTRWLTVFKTLYNQVLYRTSGYLKYKSKGARAGSMT